MMNDVQLCEFPDDDGHIVCRREATHSVIVTVTQVGRPPIGVYTMEVRRLECAPHAAAETLRNTYSYIEGAAS